MSSFSPITAEPGDLVLFQQTLDSLWSVAAGAPDGGKDTWSALDRFEEVQGDEEAEGTLAFAEDGIVALWYATQFMRKGDKDFALHCASVSYDSAGFVDDAVDEAESFADREAQEQLDDLAQIEGGESVTGLQSRARAEAERIHQAVIRAEG